MGTVPQETCSECKKAIGHNAHAHLLGDRVVCAACRRKLVAPPTDFQVEEAARRGIAVPAGITRVDLAALMTREADAAQMKKLHAAARSAGIQFAADETWQQLEAKIERREETFRWAVSVWRHVSGARWARYREATAVKKQVWAVAAEIEADPALLQQVLDAARAERTSDHDFETECYDRRVEPDFWIFFGGDGGLSIDLPAYQQTKIFVERLTGSGT